MTFHAGGPNTTAMMLIGEAEPARALSFLDPLVSSVVRKQLETQITTLKQVIEQTS